MTTFSATYDCSDDKIRIRANSRLDGFERVIMNPPFSIAQDIAHIRHALTFLRPGGRLVAICANGPRQQAELRPLATTWQELPDGTFSDQGTNVRTVLMTVQTT